MATPDRDGGLTPEDLEAAGLYDPGAPDAANRLTALQLLIEHGATLEELQEDPGMGALAAQLVA